MKKKEYNIKNNGHIIRFETRSTFPITTLYLNIILEKDSLLLSEVEIDEFCELLQEKKREIWKEE